VIESVRQAGIYDILVITAVRGKAFENIAAQLDARTAYNEDYETSEMLYHTTWFGKSNLPGSGSPYLSSGINLKSSREIYAAYAMHSSKTSSIWSCLATNYDRGHPWLVAASTWDELIQLQPSKSPRRLSKRARRRRSNM